MVQLDLLFSCVLLIHGFIQHATETWASLTRTGGTKPMRPSSTNTRLMLYCVTMMVSRIPHTLPKPTTMAIQRAPRLLKASAKGALVFISW